MTTPRRRRATDEPQIRRRRMGLFAGTAIVIAAAVVALVVGVIALNTLSGRNAELAQLARENRQRIHDIAANARRIEQSRRDSLEQFCRVSQRQNAAIIQFLEDLHARPATLARARALFPTGQDCAKQAKRRAPTP